MWLGRAYGEKADSLEFCCGVQPGEEVKACREIGDLDGKNVPQARTDCLGVLHEAPAVIGGGTDKALTTRQNSSRPRSSASTPGVCASGRKEKRLWALPRPKNCRRFEQAATCADGLDWVNLANLYVRPSTAADGIGNPRGVFQRQQIRRCVVQPPLTIITTIQDETAKGCHLLRQYVAAGGSVSRLRSSRLITCWNDLQKQEKARQPFARVPHRRNLGTTMLQRQTR